jgi:OOP family OmpA-OmpF porin
MMKKLLTFLFLVTMVTSLSGQTSDKRWSLGLMGGKTEYEGDLGNTMFRFNPFYGLGAISINHYMSPSFDISVQGELGNMGFDNGTDVFLAKKIDASFLLKYKFNNGFTFDEDAMVAPYFAFGAGLAGFSGALTNKENSDGIFPVGGGLKINLSPDIALQLQVLYNFTTGDTRDLKDDGIRNDNFLANSIGIVVNFGKAKDTDKDGVPDKLDKCLNTTAGTKVTQDGCPVDGDGDGIADYLDKCPAVAGLATFDGCPDTDGDGIQDSQDKCPAVKGLAALNGCPDADGDGIIDSEDKCPDKKGLAALNGCPDTDGDGITDALDRCPAVKGPEALEGCPDSDGDGIADIDDKCPTVSGIKENKGCPAVKEETLKVFTQALSGITFETGKDVIKPTSFSILNNVVSIMNNNPEYNLEINGHTDSVGDDAKNLDLSQRRADAVKKYITDKGIAAIRMSAKGYGETIPVADNNSPAGRAKNRRVEFKVVF